MVAEDQRAWHAGVAAWAGETDINSASVGIEIHNPGHELGYPEFPEAQIARAGGALRAISWPGIASAPNAYWPTPTWRRSARRTPARNSHGRGWRASGIGHWVPPVAVNAPTPAWPEMPPDRRSRCAGHAGALRLRHRSDRRFRSADRVRGHRLPAPFPSRARRRPHRPVDHHDAGTPGGGAACAASVHECEPRTQTRGWPSRSTVSICAPCWCCSPAAPAGASTSRPSRSPTPASRRSLQVGLRSICAGAAGIRLGAAARRRSVRARRHAVAGPAGGPRVRRRVPGALCRARSHHRLARRGAALSVAVRGGVRRALPDPRRST